MLFRRTGGRHGVLTVAATACAAAGGVLLAVSLPPSPPPSAPPSGVPARVEPAGPDAPAAGPARLRIPRVGVHTEVETVGLDKDGSIGMPEDADHTGWYSGSASPGSGGNAVMVGHVDSATGPAVFYGLDAVSAGDTIVVERRGAGPVRYTVTAKAVHPADAFPSAEVYRPTLTPRLTLLTCADWDSESRTYRSNLVVTAVLDRK
ncbi:MULTISPECIES: class F sortase [Streptomyces]|uniref:Class F sortase n=1 Tax=Streptomyces albidoflavus TaxID=1886 RepID=A0ABY3GQ83_9ACTN|nr:MULTISPECIES: class F sortase [Streptomyces]NVI31811.1 class F sortase [Streptomyces sp. CAI-17]SCE03296.1 Sortase family protein [Streptomyces sp. ScaeMP-6W]MBO1288201.1 class F sortase [Streptomyces sampsonii]TWV16359.1 class F sortase [Streptomyces albidoflavus]BDH70189.1 hypothetical protein MTP06_36380 [Streptomyces sp. PLM4]